MSVDMFEFVTHRISVGMLLTLAWSVKKTARWVGRGGGAVALFSEACQTVSRYPRQS